MSMTPEQMQAWTLQKELDERNRPLSDDDLDTMLPPGYKVRLLVAPYLSSDASSDMFNIGTM